MERVETVVVGAGVVGLAVARALARAGQSVLILEAAKAIGTGISARNSEVIHAGIYYPPGSLKARLCRRGRDLLYAFCQDHAVDHQRCGKLIVATDASQESALHELAQRARANDVEDLQWLSAAEARALEPALHCTAALLSPSTGIIDSHGLMLALLAEAEAAGATLVRNTPVLGAEAHADGVLVHTRELTLQAQRLINGAGLGAQALAAKLHGLSPAHVPPLSLAKGNYFAFSGRSPFSHLIYPAPEKHGLGVHLTLDLAGQARFGPDVEWVETEDYAVDPARAHGFYAAIRHYWPDLPDGSLQAAYAGIRPKPHRRDEPGQDFLISGPQQHGIPGLVNLFGIESPGLTASLAIGEAVAGLI